MKNDAQTFLAQLASLPSDSFEKRFSQNSTQLGLGQVLNRNELTLLYETALRATLCNAVINSLSNGKIDPKDEPRRSKSEEEFMVAREIFYASAGWQNLTPHEQQGIQRLFLNVSVGKKSLAG
jgi:hypothetical protein